MLNAPQDCHTGEGTIDDTATVCLPFTDLIAGSAAFALWLINKSAKPIEVFFEPSPDGVHPDAEFATPFDTPPGKAAYVQRAAGSELRRFWSIVARCPTYAPGDTISVQWGVTIARP